MIEHHFSAEDNDSPCIAHIDGRGTLCGRPRDEHLGKFRRRLPRRRAGYSVLEREQAQERLNAALKAVYANVGPSPVLVEIRGAMKLLDMEEDRPDGVQG